MRSKRIPAEEQYRLITECRQSGLTDHQWCVEHDINKTISTQTELIQSLQKTLEADRLEKENLHQQIEYLTKKLFGTSSEKRKNINGQLNLFDEAEQEADPTWEQELPDDITVPEHKRKARRTHADLFKNVPSCNEIISLPEEERNCPTCGTQMECIGKECLHLSFWCKRNLRVT